jgi:hypothetical protein
MILVMGKSSVVRICSFWAGPLPMSLPVCLDTDGVQLVARIELEIAGKWG